MIANTTTGEVRTVLTERDEAWVDVVDDFRWIDQGNSFTWISERGGWRQLYRCPRQGGEPKRITSEAYDVIDVVRVDDKAGGVDFIASPDDPKARYLFRGPLDGSAPPRRLTPVDQSGTNAYQISEDGRWAFQTHSSFGHPPTVNLISLPDHKVIRTLVDNAQVQRRLDELAPVASEFFRVGIGEGVELDGWCLKPPGFDPSEAVFVAGPRLWRACRSDGARPVGRPELSVASDAG